MRDIYAVSCDEIVGSCKNCGNLTINCGLMKKRKKSDSPKTLYSLGYSLNVKSNFLLLPMISKHTTSQKVLGIFEFSSWFISDLNGSNLQNIDELDKFCNFTKKKKNCQRTLPRSSCFSPGRSQYCARGQRCRIRNSLPVHGKALGGKK